MPYRPDLFRAGNRRLALALGVLLTLSVAAYLKPRRAMYGVVTANKQIVLTFDTEADCNHAAEKLDVLKQHNVHATFFVTGEWVERWPEVARRLVRDGHEVAGNHSYTHPVMGKITAWEIWREMAKTDAAIRRVVGERPLYFRPPYGDYDRRVRWVADRFGYKTVLWSTDTRDWARPGVNKIVDTVLQDAGPGKVVLFHLSAEQTNQALPEVIEGLRSRGYQLVTLTEALRAR